MSYARIEASALWHPKIQRLSAEAFRVWVAALAYARNGMTDGALPDLTSKALGCAVRRSYLKQLVLVGLFDLDNGVYRIHDFGHYNPLKAEIDRKRALGRTRYARWRSGQETALVDDAPNALANALVASSPASSNALANALLTRTLPSPPSTPLPPLRATDPENGSVHGSTGVGGGTGGGGGPIGTGIAAAAFWEDFTEVGRAHGFDHRIQATPREYGHCLQLTGAYTPDELHAMAVAFWASPYLPASRNLGYFANKVGALFHHVTRQIREPFDAPVDARGVAAAAAAAALEKWGTT